MMYVSRVTLCVVNNTCTLNDNTEGRKSSPIIVILSYLKAKLIQSLAILKLVYWFKVQTANLIG